MKKNPDQNLVRQSRWVSVSILLLAAGLLMPARLLANTAETQGTADASGSSSITGTANWTPATTISPTNVLAVTYDYATATTLRTPANQNSYTVNANSLSLNASSSMGFKGSNVLTIPNLILNGGKIANSGTSGNPDMGRLAGNINLTASSSLAPNGAGTFLNLFSVITNSGSSSFTLTVNAAGTVILSAQNTFTGNFTVNSVAGGAILQLGTNNAVPATAIIQLNSGSSNPGGVFDLHGYSTTIAGLNPTSGTIVGFATNTAVGTTSTLTISNNGSFAVNNGILADNPATAGTVALAVTGSGTITLNTADTYHGSTTISRGTLALGAAGSINNSPSISIASGATFDVSQISSYTLGSGTTLSASGSGGTPATINGGSTVSLGAQPVTLVSVPTTFTGDASHPALLISQGDLTLNNNSFTVNNASGTPLGAGTYQLIQVNSGNINQNASPAYALTMTGSGLVTNSTAAIQVSGGSVNLVVTLNANPAPVFSNLTASQSITYGTGSVTLSGTVSHGSTYPANGESITVSINGNAQATTINDSTGDFSISYNLSGIPATASPYTITYSYGGDGSLGPAANTSTTLTVQKATPAISGVTASQAISYGTATITLAGTVGAGSIYPPPGETISINIDGNQQNTTIADSTGDFSISYNSANIPGGAWSIAYGYAGDASFTGTTNSSTTLTVQTNTITENLTTTDPGNFSSLIATNNWTPATTVVPTNSLATNYNFITALTLRTPPGASNYTVYAQSLTITTNGSMGFKGNGLITIPNLILNGGKIANSSTGGNPDEGQLAGSVNLTANSTLAVNNAATSMIDIFSTITNVAGISPVLTCSGGGTIILSAQNTFNGSIVVAGNSVGTILQLGTNNALPAGTTVTLNGNTGVNGPGALDLNGFSTTVSNLTFSSTAPNYGYVTNSASGTSGTLTLGYGDTTETLQYGTIAGNPTNGGTVGLAKIGAGTLSLAISATYSGNTTISAGTLALTGSGAIPNSAVIAVASNATFDVSQVSFVLGASQVLSGGGMVNGSIQADGTIAPVGTLVFNGNLTFDGNLTFRVNTSRAQSNDVLSVVNGAPNNTGTGTLTVNNTGPALVAGQKFYLFDQPLPNGGSLTIVPPAGVVFTNNLALDGSLTVVSSQPPQPPHITGISLSGTDLVINGTNGLAGEQYNVLTTTNLTLPLSQWTVLPTNMFTGGSFSITNPMSSGSPRNFYILRVP
jgi:autotransporter-associated beta strand protein